MLLVKYKNRQASSSLSDDIVPNTYVFWALANMRKWPYRSGHCREWIMIKNPAHPAIERAMLIAMAKQQSKRR